jgi:hypothetical protein
MRRSLFVVIAALALVAAAGCLTGEDPGTDGATDDGEQPTGTGNATTMTWEQRAPVPTARTEVATAIVDGELYVIGGFEEDDQPSRTVEVLDLATDEWREGPSLPTPLHHARAVDLGGAVHVFGGYNAVPFQATPTHLVLDPGSGSWQEAGPLPVARGGHGAAVLNASVFLVGGVGPDDELLERVDVYHADNGTYTRAPDLPSPRDHLGLAASEDWVHAIGGREQSLASNVATHEVLVPGQEWVEASPMPTARGGVDATSWQGSIVVAGGEGDEGTFDEVEAYATSRDEWRPLDPMPTARHGLGVDAHDGELITTAGGPDPGLTVSDAVEVLVEPASEGGS